MNTKETIDHTHAHGTVWANPGHDLKITEKHNLSFSEYKISNKNAPGVTRSSSKTVKGFFLNFC